MPLENSILYFHSKGAAGLMITIRDSQHYKILVRTSTITTAWKESKIFILKTLYPILRGIKSESIYLQ